MMNKEKRQAAIDWSLLFLFTSSAIAVLAIAAAHICAAMGIVL